MISLPGERMGLTSKETPADGMKRRDFLEAAAGAAVLGGFAANEATAQQSNTEAAAAPGDAGQLYKRHAPKLRGTAARSPI